MSNWDFDPLGGEVKDGFVHGRGTVDQEGGPAAFVTTGRILKELGFDKDLTIYFVGSVMEEDCDGLCWKYIIEEDKIKPDFAISTEPTNLNIYRGHRGRMEIDHGSWRQNCGQFPFYHVESRPAQLKSYRYTLFQVQLFPILTEDTGFKSSFSALISQSGRDDVTMQPNVKMPRPFPAR
jgi:hypothetical protein